MNELAIHALISFHLNLDLTSLLSHFVLLGTHTHTQIHNNIIVTKMCVGIKNDKKHNKMGEMQFNCGFYFAKKALRINVPTGSPQKPDHLKIVNFSLPSPPKK